MGYFIKSFTEVEEDAIHLVSPLECLFEVIDCSYISCVSVDLCFLKPCWVSESILWVSKCVMMWERIICSRSLHKTEVREMGR